ncbi:hypothetical protein LAZ67_2002381 [Cordylochernes scorpioides]|uniref:Tc1-like transposase DDE domain-containing protein n=1 Tax=Cordylochernes scorpioides TaxID=51811 RepID=A0ABY6K353_9ARAC|nr:hypothetical protein LAZ67_2002381 [Cordylochernes scorpioides]
MTEWHKVVFSDESRFCLSSDSRRVRVWRRRGERSNPAAIGTMTAQRYVDDVLRPVTLPYLQGVPNALYQQDNARPHTARISQQALQDVQMLPWPPYSPDLSPIEHVWDIIGRRLHALPQPRSEDELWQMIPMYDILVCPSPVLTELMWSPGAAGLRLVSLDMPTAVAKGESLWLNCTLDLENDELYSVKWYKNDVEFYRYLPRDRPASQKYDLPGIFVDGIPPHTGFAVFTRQQEEREEETFTTKSAYGDAVMSRRRVFECYKRFKEGREETADNERSERPSTSTTPEKVDKVLKLVREDRRITVREVAEEAGISFGSTQSIMKDILGVRRLNAVLVPKDLTFDQKNARKETASLNLEATTDDPELMKRVITGDETLIYGFDSETTEQASEWRFKNEPRPKKARKALSKVKVMLTVFFDYQGIVHHEFQQQGSITTADSYLGLLSPDLAPCDFFLIGKLKKIKGSEISEHRRDQSGIEEGDPENRLPEVFCRLEKKVAEVHRGQWGLL